MATRKELIERVHGTMTGMMMARAGTPPLPWRDIDLTMAQMKALIFLHHHGGGRVGEVAQSLDMSPNATTAVLDRLEQHGLIRREQDPSYRRAVLVALTELGTERMEQLFTANMQHFTGLLEQLALADLRALDQGIAALGAVVRKQEPAQGPDAAASANDHAVGRRVRR